MTLINLYCEHFYIGEYIIFYMRHPQNLNKRTIIFETNVISVTYKMIQLE